MSGPAAPLLEARDLSVWFNAGRGETQVTNTVSFTIAPGETVALVGESGCGKTVTGLAIMGLLPRRRSRIGGSVLFNGADLVGLRASEMRRLRGRRISMIFQEPMSALDPVFTVGQQISETLRAHFDISPAEARGRAIEALARVGIPEPVRIHDAYPHQLSGGMRQRVMIAIAIVCEPSLLIADEPTTALDVTVQAQIVDVLGDLCARLGMAMLFITHDLGLVAETCTRLVTMYAGQVVEEGTTDAVLVAPQHPYTSSLLRSLPGLTRRRHRLPAIPGRVPLPAEMPSGCRFAPRCPHAAAACVQPQALRAMGPRLTRCARAGEIVLPGVLKGAS